MKIEQLSAKHPLAPNLAPLARAAFEATYRPFNPDSLIDEYLTKHMSHASIQAELAEQTNIFLAAIDGGSLAGYVKLRENSPVDIELPDTMEIERIYAAAGQTGMGTGKLLMEAAIKTARDLGRKSVWLGVWENNLRAVRFYEREGFVCEGQVTFMMADDEQTDKLMVRRV